MRALALLALWPGLAWGACDPVPPPVVSLAFDSRYAADDATRSEVDPEAERAAEDAIAPVDDFLVALVTDANRALRDRDSDRANCVVDAITAWARAGALGDLGSPTAALTIGSRYAGFALVLAQVAPLTSRDPDPALDWLSARMETQLDFWEDEAPPGARHGNLRAWAALAGAATAALTQDDHLAIWAAWSATTVLCTAAPDGALPQEMRRGRLALRYQLHALAPLAVTALLLDRQGIPITAVCGGALDRAVMFAIRDLEAGGAATAAITGAAQSLFDGSDELEGFQLAWTHAYLALGTASDPAAVQAAAAPFLPLRYSKLGGDQALIWGG